MARLGSRGHRTGEVLGARRGREGLANGARSEEVVLGWARLPVKRAHVGLESDVLA